MNRRSRSNIMDSQDRKNIAMMGCFRSGTNFAKALLEQNYYCNVKNNVFGWKHGFLPIISSDSNASYSFDYDKAFFITKNPFSFLFSLFKFNQEVKRNLKAPFIFKNFIRSKIIVFDQANPRSPELRFSSPVDFWNAMNWNYASHKDFVHIRYEMLIEKPEFIINKAAEKMSLERTSGNFFVPEKKVKRINDGEVLSKADDYQTKEAFDKSSYLSHDYMASFDSDDIRCVMKELDSDLISRLGYSELIASLKS